MGRMGRASYRPRYDRTPTPQLTFLSSDDTHSEHPCCLSLPGAPGMFRQSPRSSDVTSEGRGDCLNMIPNTLTPQPAPPLSSRGASSEAPTRHTHIRLAPAVRRSSSTASPPRVVADWPLRAAGNTQGQTSTEVLANEDLPTPRRPRPLWRSHFRMF